MTRILKSTLTAIAGTALVFGLSQKGRAEELQPLAITDYGGKIVFEALYETETAESKTRDQEFVETTFQETIEIVTEGYVYHPNLLEFDVGLKLGLGQEEESGEVDDSRETELFGYNIHLAIEKQRPYGFEFFAFKDRQTVQQDFSENNLVDVEEYSLLWQNRNPILPTLIQISTMEKIQTGAVDRTEDEQRLRINSSNIIGDFSRTTISYELRDFAEKETDFELLSHDFNVVNTLTWGGEQEKTLFTTFRYSLDEETTTSEQITGSSNLSWNHTDNFESFYRINVLDTSISSPDAETINTTTHNEEVGFRHQLYENLTTVASFDHYASDSNALGRQQDGGQLDFTYTRPIPIGRINANLGFSLHKTDQKSTGGPIPIIDESHILSDAATVFLDNINIDLTTVVVTDVTGTIVYTEGVDYNLSLVGERVRITRIITGSITDGQGILVDYFFSLGGDFVYYTQGFRAGAGAELFGRFSIKYSYESQLQDFEVGNLEDSSAQDIRTHRIDARVFESRPSGLHYELSAFYENRDATFSPSESYGFDSQVGWPMLRRSETILSASYTQSNFPDTGDDTDVLTLTATWISRFSPSTRLMLNSVYRDIGGTLDDSESLELGLSFETSFRLVRISLQAEYEDATESGQKREQTSVFLKLTREF